jgi:RNA polymerase sigma-70 factor (sigma-E family)
VAAQSPTLLRTAILLCSGDVGAAEELVQDVLARMYPKWRRFRGHPEAYARAALANAAIDRWRRRSRQVTETPLVLVPAPAVAGPEQSTVDRARLLSALATLPARMRAVLVLRFFDDLTEVDTAAALGCSVGTVKSQAFRGLNRLRELLASESDGTAEARNEVKENVR